MGHKVKKFHKGRFYEGWFIDNPNTIGRIGLWKMNCNTRSNPKYEYIYYL